MAYNMIIEKGYTIPAHSSGALISTSIYGEVVTIAPPITFPAIVEKTGKAFTVRTKKTAKEAISHAKKHGGIIRLLD